MNSPEAALSFRELLAYTDYLANRWVDYFRENSGALDIDIGGKTGSLRELVHHVFMVEQFFANRPAQKESPAKLESPTLDELIHMHRTAHSQLINYAATTGDDALRATQSFGPVAKNFQPEDSCANRAAQRASLGPGRHGSASGRFSGRQAARHYHHGCDGVSVKN